MAKARIQDDLYDYVNHDWLETAVIPDDKPTTGGFANLGKAVEDTLMADFAKMSETGEYPDEDMKRAVELYVALKDVKRRNREGIRPALKAYKKLLKLSNVNQFNRNLKEFVYDDVPLPFRLSVDPDMKDTTRHAVMIQGASTILPDTTYYQPGMEQQHDMILGIWRQMASAVMAETRLTEEEQQKFIEDAIAFDAILAKWVKSSVEWADYANVYNPMTTRRVSGLMKPIKFRKLLQDLFGEAPERIIVAEPRYFKGFSEIFNEETFPLYAHWAYVKAIIGATPALSERLREKGSIYRRALSGIAVMATPEKHAYQVASSVYSEPVGLYYGRKYFGEEAKADVIEMVKEIIAKYEERIQTNEVLSPSTKEKATLKLKSIVVKMGYPDKCEEIYSKLVFNPEDSAFDIMNQLSRIRIIDALSKLSKPVDRSTWAMPGHMVNACYNPFSNDITFPAAILQAPFYSIEQSRSENLGGIGAVIGHEISHAFDNNGAKFDEKGNLQNWWTKEDHKNFLKKTKAMIKQFDGIELPWGKVNGELIVSENIADNGGMAVTLDIMGDTEDACYVEYFLNWGKIWCMKAKEQYLQLLLSVDVHAPTVLRANMQPRNFPEWYETFEVTKKDKMYLAPNKRIVIW